MANAFSSNPNSRTKPDAEGTNPQQAQYSQYDGVINEDLNNMIIEHENILLKYHNWTYNFALYTMSASDFKLFQVNSNEQVQRYVVAQSGVSARYSINDVKMISVSPGSPGKTTNSSILQIDMDLTEQNGMNFYNDLVVLSNQLRYKKFMDIPFILELKFIGQDQDTGVMTEIPDTRKFWKVRINTVNTSASEDGGTMTHKLNLVAMRNIYDNPAWILKEPFECTVSTFGEFCQELENKLNSMSDEQYGYLKTIIPMFNDGKFFEFTVSDKLKNMRMVVDSKQDQETGKTKSLAYGSRTFRFDAKTNISTVIDNVIDCCSSITSDNTIDPQNRQFVQVVPSVKYAGYDPYRFTSAYKYYYFVVPFFTGDVKEYNDIKPDSFNLKYFIDNAPKYNDPNTNLPKLLAKRYDYQFTGENLEILNLDLKFDSQFYLAINRNPYSALDQENSTGTHVAQQIIFGNESFNVDSNSDLGHLYEVREKVQKDIDAGTATEEQKQFAREADIALQERKTQYEGEEQANDTFSSVAGDDVYIEDFRDEFDLNVAGTEGVGGSYVRTIPVETSNIAETNSNTTVENSSPFELYRRMNKSNYYNRSFLIQLDMDVIGDPYWLGWSDDAYTNYLNAALTAQQIELNEERNSANFLTSESYLILNLRPGTKISDVTGIMDISDDDIFAQTIYRVLQITHTFSSGKFTQHLNGALIIRSLRKNAEDGNA